jgi:hypothetical protein
MIPIRISEDALQDLNEGFLLYEAQEGGLGDYCVTCLRADIESLRVHAGIHRVVYRDFHRLLSRVSPMGSSTPWRTALRWSGRWLTSEGIRAGSAIDWVYEIEPAARANGDQLMSQEHHSGCREGGCA